MRILKSLGRVFAIAVIAGLTTFSVDVSAKTLKFGAVLPSGVENAWTAALIESFEKVKASKPHGLDMELAYSESVFGPDALTAMERYAEEGFDVVWGHSSYSDQVEELKDAFPNTIFVTVGSGNRILGGNAYLLYMHLHEPAYLAGVFAASESKSGALGVVGLFPADDVNDQVNAFRAGARSINENAKVIVTFIESWYDPVKAAEAANAQIAAGADIIFQLGESFQTCRERGVMCIGNYIDSSKVAPDVVPTSTLVSWEPHLNYIVNEWKKHNDTGTNFEAPEEVVWFSMANGGGDLSPITAKFIDKVSGATKTAIEKARADILSGVLEVKLDMSLPVSD